MSDKGFNKDLDQFLDYFEKREERKREIENLSPIPPVGDDHDEVFQEASPQKLDGLEAFQNSPIAIASQPGQSGSPFDDNSGLIALSPMSPMAGKGSPMRTNDTARFDLNTKKMIESMQAKIIKLELDNRKTKERTSGKQQSD